MTRYLLPLFLCIAGMGQSVNQERPTTLTDNGTLITADSIFSQNSHGCVGSFERVGDRCEIIVSFMTPQPVRCSEIDAQQQMKCGYDLQLPSLPDELAAFIEYQHADYMMEHFCLTHTCEAQVKYREISKRVVKHKRKPCLIGQYLGVDNVCYPVQRKGDK